MHKIFHMIKFFVLLAISAGLFYFAHDTFGKIMFGTVGVLAVMFIIAEAMGLGEIRNM